MHFQLYFFYPLWEESKSTHVTHDAAQCESLQMLRIINCHPTSYQIQMTAHIHPQEFFPGLLAPNYMHLEL